MTQATLVPFEYDAWEAANRSRTLARIARLKPAVLASLRALGVRRAEVQFDGCGDDGSIEDILCHGAEGAVTLALETILISVLDENGVAADIKLEDALEDLATRALELNHPGWENNDGATGALEIDVADARFTLDCKLRYTAYDEHAWAL